MHFRPLQNTVFKLSKLLNGYKKKEPFSLNSIPLHFTSDLHVYTTILLLLFVSFRLSEPGDRITQPANLTDTSFQRTEGKAPCQTGPAVELVTVKWSDAVHSSQLSELHFSDKQMQQPRSC